MFFSGLYLSSSVTNFLYDRRESQDRMHIDNILINKLMDDPSSRHPLSQTMLREYRLSKNKHNIVLCK